MADDLAPSVPLDPPAAPAQSALPPLADPKAPWRPTPGVDPVDSALAKLLVSLIRADDHYGSWEKRTNADLLGFFLLTKETRRSIPILGNPSPEKLGRLEQFYKAICFRIEQRTGMMAAPLLSTSHEGFGTAVLIVGKLVVFQKSLRDVHRFGFETIELLVREGEKIVEEAVKTTEAFSEAARA
jgi:probable nitrogen fixation protein